MRASLSLTVPDAHLQGVEDQVGAHRRAGAPAGDHPRVHVDAERDVDEPDPGRHVGEVHHPQLVGPLRDELALHQVLRACGLRVRVGSCGSWPRVPHRQPVLAHQPLHGAAGDLRALPGQLPPHLASPIDPVVVLIHATDLDQQLRVTNRPGAPRSLHRRPVGARSDLTAVLCEHAQIGTTPSSPASTPLPVVNRSWRCSSMNFTSVVMGGRAPPRRRPRPSSRSRWPAAAPGSRPRAP